MTAEFPGKGKKKKRCSWDSGEKNQHDVKRSSLEQSTRTQQTARGGHNQAGKGMRKPPGGKGESKAPGLKRLRQNRTQVHTGPAQGDVKIQSKFPKARVKTGENIRNDNCRLEIGSRGLLDKPRQYRASKTSITTL